MSIQVLRRLFTVEEYHSMVRAVSSARTTVWNFRTQDIGHSLALRYGT